MSSNSTIPTSAATLNILIVNQDESALDQIFAHLTNAGCNQLTMVNSANKALRALRKLHVDLLILDVDTQDMDGWRLARLVRSGILECRADMPIIIMTSTWCERIAEITAREYGINFLLALNQLEKLPAMVEQLCIEPKSGITKPRLLIIEDEPDTADLIRRLLSAAFDIEIAGDGIAGIKAWEAGQQDLVLLDVMLPHLSGREVLIEIQRINPNQPVVIMTAHAAIDQAEELMLLGAVDFLPKPFRADQLRKVCDIALRRDDYLVSNAQFAERAKSLQEREQAFRRLYESHHQLLDTLQTVVMELDDNLTICFLNRAWEKLMGFNPQSSMGRPLEDFIALEDAHPLWLFKERMSALRQHSEQHIDVDLCLTNQQQKKLWVQLQVSMLHNNRDDTLDRPRRFSVCLNDVTAQRTAQEKLKFLASHDSLTKLYNRHHFEQSLEKLTREALQQHTHHWLIYIDLDHFKIINDTHGHQKGDEVLHDVAQLLNRIIRKPNIFCRLGGDEFALLLRNITSEEALACAQHIQRNISDFSVELQSQRINLGCSIGMTLIDSSVDSPQEHLRRADIALYVAKGRGRNLIHQFSPADNDSDELRLRLDQAQRVRKAITEDRMLLYFQPIFDVTKNEISYYEALIRMRDLDGKIVGPHEFIPALEASGEMHFLDRRVINLATRALQQQPALKHIAINLSAQAFKDENLVPIIVQNLQETQVKPHCITFELTESASLFNMQITQRVIADLHALGCSFSVDDFGSGFSSFTYLKELPADFIKLDGSFIQNLHRDKVDQKLVRSIIQVIQALGKKAVAEYVENEEILELLIEMKIDFVQGYHIGRPQPLEELFPAPPTQMQQQRRP